MTSLQHIEDLTKHLANAKEVLSDRIQVVEDEHRQILRSHKRRLKAAVDQVATKEAELDAAIDANQHLFVKPKTQVFHGIKVGLQKAKDKLEYDEEQVIKAIKEHLRGKKTSLVKQVEKLISKALTALSEEQLETIGVTVKTGKDCVVIKPMNSDIEKLVKVWLEDLKKVEE